MIRADNPDFIDVMEELMGYEPSSIFIEVLATIAVECNKPIVLRHLIHLHRDKIMASTSKLVRVAGNRNHLHLIKYLGDAK